MAIEPSTLSTAINNASTVANTPLFTTIIDKLTGFKISQWSAEGDLRKKIIQDEYERAKENGIMGIQYIENLRHITNLIETATKSAKYIDPKKPNKIEMDNDFFWNTVEHAKTISNDEMQELIAKIIAGEYNQPGTYSMSTLHTLKMLGKEELNVFEKICSLIIGLDDIPQTIFQTIEQQASFMIESGIDFGTLQMLQNLGLFLPNSMSHNRQNTEGHHYRVVYFDENLIYESLNVNNHLIKVPAYYSLSKTGLEIKKHLNPKFNQKYFEWLQKNYRINGYKFVAVAEKN